MSARISELSATLTDDYGHHLNVEWDGRSALLSVYPAGTTDGPSVMLQLGGLTELHRILGQLLAGRDPEGR
jgi:hypothetical protein